MSDLAAFTLGGPTVALTPNNSSSSADLEMTGGTVRVWNAGATVAFLKTGIGATTAAATDVPLAPGAIETFRVPANHTKAAAYSTGSVTVYVTAGRGL